MDLIAQAVDLPEKKKTTQTNNLKKKPLRKVTLRWGRVRTSDFGPETPQIAPFIAILCHFSAKI